MKSISIDIETFSSVSLQKSGVYRYAESDDFEILLFGYSVDGGEVKVVDLAMGEKIPDDIIDALTDDEVIKWALMHSLKESVCPGIFVKKVYLLRNIVLILCHGIARWYGLQRSVFHYPWKE